MFIPLVFICIFLLSIIKRDSSVFPVAFFAGLLLDLLTVRPLGLTSIFFLCVVLLVLLYQRKYEINSYPFVLTASFLGSLLFLWIFGYGNIFLQSVLSSILAVILFAGLRRIV